MCKGKDDTLASLVSARCMAVGDGAWALGLRLSSDHPLRLNRPPTQFHFVLDNSGSMGRNTLSARNCFADLVELANGPCSLTVFNNNAEVLGDKFRTAAAVRAVALPRQGQTNITAGVQAALDIISRCEAAQAAEEDQPTHHVLILLSDGVHNTGPRPEVELPVTGSKIRSQFPQLRLSVVVVGVTANSNTSMGMLLKQSLETVALPSLDPIYFASTPQVMGDVLKEMHAGLASLRGSLVNVTSGGDFGFVKEVGAKAAQSINILAEANENTLMCQGKEAPKEVIVAGCPVACVEAESADDFDCDLVADALQTLLDAVRVQRVAAGADNVQPALKQLSSWITCLETRMVKMKPAHGLQLAKASPSNRVSQHKALMRVAQGARELRNQLADIEAHKANDSASQAAFLTGANSKYGAKALRRAHGDGAVDSQQRFQELSADLSIVASKMKQALRQDLCAKINFLLPEMQQQLCLRVKEENRHVAEDAIEDLCFGRISDKQLNSSGNEKLAHLVDSGTIVEPLLELTGGMRKSFVSLNTAWEQLKEWGECAAAADATCRTEYELLMFLGTLGYPVDIQRRAATQMDPFAMDVTRVRASLADTASLSTALQSDQQVVPPEGGVAIQDLLVLIDPDAPRASRLAANSLMLKESYTSVTLCRDLHMFSGNKMRIALHAHGLLSAVQGPPPAPLEDDLVAQLRRQYLGRAFQCANCSFGPIDHFACGDLAAHHGEQIARGVSINNACPKCNWFSSDIDDWPQWDGTVPSEALKQGHEKSLVGKENVPTAASLEIALRICYSARAIWQTGSEGEAHKLLDKLANWDPLTSADGVDHPVQLLLALAICDDVPDNAMGQVPMRTLLNEVCARQARNELRMKAGTDESAVSAEAHKHVCAFLGITPDSAPTAKPVDEPEPSRQAVEEACSAEYALNSEAFDSKAWVRRTLLPWVPALNFVKRLRSILSCRDGGWTQLARDMETGPMMYEDVINALQKAPCPSESLRAHLGVPSPNVAPRVIATIAAQAFLHQSSAQRRTIAAGGNLHEPLGDVNDSETLRKICVALRMAIYEQRVAVKMREWGRLGADISFQRARAADLSQYSSMCGSHVHGLDRPTFWGLWKAAKMGGYEKTLQFLRTANSGFVNKHGSC
eukprot:gnl/MRDRNA2_/MRDRNA2_100464_c0_seq1.p1 gnl/MRDRNA2_/MRDRNA2_100464_c0~~gnl/MRDRNA2_/MRDRNA2_100464_c0_seq1.p1  ORF type:complete len:1140 (+),score=257.13 gnl/MRDRNA2_/MRDRNA2_100464_c0_seq1:110-3529(+)